MNQEDDNTNNGHQQQQQQQLQQQQQQHQDMLDMDPEQRAIAMENLAHLFLRNQLEQHSGTFNVIAPRERQWALELKQAVEEDSSRFDPLQDMEYAHHAIVAGGNVAEALTRIEGMQMFKREYHVTDTVEQAMEMLTDVYRQQPGFILHMDICPHTQEGVLVLDLAAFSPAATVASTKEMSSDETWRMHVVGFYYMFKTCQPSLASVREGLFELIECEGVSWTNISMEHENRLHAEMWGYYPLKWKKILAYNTALVANLAWSLIKPLMSEPMKQSLHLGCQLVESDPYYRMAPRRLSQLYLQPNPEIARQHTLMRARDLLAIRFQNEQNFRL